MNDNRKMKASVYKGNGVFEVETWDIPVPGPEEVLVNIKSAGICGSDMLGYFGKTQNRKPGLVFGHEAAGIITEVGEKVTQWKVGDRVAIFPLVTCGTCEYCRRGLRNLCKNGSAVGSNRLGTRHGAMCEYMVMPGDHHLIRLPDNVNFEDGALAEPMGNCLHAMNRAEIKAGDTVAIIGAGSIGLLAIQAAKIQGPKRVIVVDTIPERLELAKEMGADVTINALEQDTVEEILKLTDGQGAEVVMNAAGNDISYMNSVFACRKRGSLIAFGYNNPDGCLQIPSEAFLFKELRMLGSGAMDDFEIATMLELYSMGKVTNISKIVTHRFGLDEVNEAFKLIAENPREAIKVLINIE